VPQKNDIKNSGSGQGVVPANIAGPVVGDPVKTTAACNSDLFLCGNQRRIEDMRLLIIKKNS